MYLHRPIMLIIDNHVVWLQKEAEDALAEALPALEAARLALDDLDKSDVTEIRSFAKPPKQVQTVCECIVVMRGKINDICVCHSVSLLLSHWMSIY